MVEARRLTFSLSLPKIYICGNRFCQNILRNGNSIVSLRRETRKKYERARVNKCERR